MKCHYPKHDSTHQASNQANGFGRLVKVSRSIYKEKKNILHKIMRSMGTYDAFSMPRYSSRSYEEATSYMFF